MADVRRWAGAALAPVVAAGLCLVLFSGTASASPNPTTTTLVSSLSPSISGQPVVFSATVAEVPPNTGVPTGVVQFEFTNITEVCQGGNFVTLVAGVAQCTSTTLLAGESPVAVTAVYQGTTVDAPSQSNPPLTQTVTTASTTVTLSSSGVHAPINESGCTTTSLSTAASCTSLTGVSAGASVTDTLGAIPPSTTVATIDRATDSLTLSNAATSSQTGDVFTFVNDPNHSLSSGSPDTFTATVAPVSPATGFPTGAVTWSITGSDSSTVLCATGSTVNLGHTLVASCKVPQHQLLAQASPYTVSAVYSGDASYTGNSGAFSQIMNAASSRTFVAGTRVPVDSATSVNFTAAVVPAKFGLPPTGTVTFAFTALPFKVANCRLTSTSAVINCPTGSLSGVVAGYDVSDVTTGQTTDIPSGTTVLSVGTLNASATLSADPTTTIAAQTLLFSPAGSGIPTVSCTGGDTLTYTSGGTTCAMPSGFPSSNAEWGLVVTYSGDANDNASTAHQFKLRTV